MPRAYSDLGSGPTDEGTKDGTKRDWINRKLDQTPVYDHVRQAVETRSFHALDEDGMVLCNARDREAAHRAEQEGMNIDFGSASAKTIRAAGPVQPQPVLAKVKLNHQSAGEP